MEDAAARRRAVVLAVAGAVLLAAGVALGAWIYLRGNVAFVVDDAWNTLLAAWWSPAAERISRVLDVLGSGWISIVIVPLGGAAALVAVRRPWSAAYFLVSATASAGVVQVLKHTFGRARPEEILVVSDFGSFPSGHVANATTLAIAALVLFPRLWVAVVGGLWIAGMAFSRTYVHAHWLSDTIGGALIGAGVALVLAAAFSGPLAGELARRDDGG
ncbi:phosphatase PAP2 family protein [Microbacterium ulmi]|uniref:Phosphatase PAP2 family protein n=1 Tax=Microbacterium ulmi TaxID=179095 RepID=A0A7Y2M242_9MICO|nr:phosphatase PAP2 family protein [Microbacterium ulmi]NII68656.1 undecaprenyl-diphosphatase [Microbacterium ulmi]NNH03678.1 phosphatase PAP2 family protein [Microbacterium ulmi]